MQVEYPGIPMTKTLGCKVNDDIFKKVASLGPKSDVL